MARTLIEHGTVVTSSEVYPGDVLIDDGKIQAIGTFSELDDVRRIDATGCFLLPGGVDPHTHMDTPSMGTVTSDDFETGTIAAAVGGTTTVIDFPIQNRGEDPRQAVATWFDKASAKVAVDFAFHEIITDVNESLLPAVSELTADGIGSFKLFMAYPGSWMLDDGDIFRVLRRSAEIGALPMMHCENGLVIDVLVKEAIRRGEIEPIYHARTRPSSSEGEATARAIALAELAQVPIYIVHLSAREALTAVEEAKGRGVRVFAETCPQYLLLDESKLEEPDFGGAKYVCSPPLRTGEHVDALWRGLANGALQAVSTDHGSFCLHGQKDVGRHDFSKIPNGMPGVEWRLALLYHHGVRTARITLSQLVDLASTTPAKLFGLYPRKGALQPGADADIVVFDPNRKKLLTVEDQYTKVDYNPYEGQILVGWPRTVLLRGSVIVDDARFVGRAGAGSFQASGPSTALQ